ncbi:MAG TPA: hypothetical protein VJB11_01100 [archaeon]|nr:hypothetical protein [archaeon]
MKSAKIGEYAYIVSVIIAIAAGVIAPFIQPITPTTAFVDIAGVSLLLVILGVVVGFLNISEKETTPFLIASVALIVAGTAGFVAINGLLPPLGTIIGSIVRNIAVFVAPAAIIVAVKAIAALASAK